MKSKEEILTILKSIKPKYEKDGLIILGIFGSVAKGTKSDFSDIDIAYHINHKKFSQNYKDGFSKVLKIESIKEELQEVLKYKVDFISDNNHKILKDLIYV